MKNILTSNKHSRCCHETEEKEELKYCSDEGEQGEPEVMGDSMMGEEKTSEVREMVTPSQQAAKNAVKLCWWTANMCSVDAAAATSAHSSYGITCHQCVEVTPRLACAEKYTF